MLSRMILLSMILWSGRSAAQTTTFDRIQLGALPPGAAVIGHFNGDGRPDVAVVQADKVLTFIGNGDGGFQEPLVTKISTGACGGLAGDFDGDGRTDLALWDKDYCVPVFNGETSILLSNGDGTFREFPDRIPDASADYVTDIDGDGLPDLGQDASAISGETFFTARALRTGTSQLLSASKQGRRGALNF